LHKFSARTLFSKSFISPGSYSFIKIFFPISANKTDLPSNTPAARGITLHFCILFLH
jgi:hypothetical protein